MQYPGLVFHQVLLGSLWHVFLEHTKCFFNQLLVCFLFVWFHLTANLMFFFRKLEWSTRAPITPYSSFILLKNLGGLKHVSGSCKCTNSFNKCKTYPKTRCFQFCQQLSARISVDLDSRRSASERTVSKTDRLMRPPPISTMMLKYFPPSHYISSLSLLCSLSLHHRPLLASLFFCPLYFLFYFILFLLLSVGASHTAILKIAPGLPREVGALGSRRRRQRSCWRRRRKEVRACAQGDATTPSHWMYFTAWKSLISFASRFSLDNFFSLFTISCPFRWPALLWMETQQRLATFPSL